MPYFKKNMIFENKEIKIKNRILIKKSSYETNDVGIITICGKNGTGKTSFLEKIVYDSNNIIFNNDYYQKLYKKKRYMLFAYVSQAIDDVDDNVFSFITKCNKRVKKEDIFSLMKRLDMDDVTLSQLYNSLSGGEKIKCSIISAILKNTPYLFLDEPTNYLDDKSVESFKKIIIEYSKNHKVILVSHDYRMGNLSSKVIFLDGHNVSLSYKNDYNCSDFSFKMEKSLNLFGVVLKKSYNLISYILLFIMLCVFCLTSVFLQSRYSLNYLDSSLPDQGQILIYDANHCFSEANNLYCINKNITIDESNLANVVYYSDVEKIKNMPGVKKIYLRDEIKRLKYYDYNLSYEIDNLELEYFSIPQKFFNNEVVLSWVGSIYWTYYICGTYPKDNMNEMAISLNFLKHYFPMEYENPEELLNQKVVFKEKEFSICGILEYDYCLISYTENEQNGGLVQYSPTSFNDFKLEQESFFVENNFFYKNPRSIIVETNEYSENDILNKLIEEYPANGFYSFVFAISRDAQNNKVFEKKVCLLLFPISLLFGIIFLLIQKRNIIVNSLRFKNYYRYYNTKVFKIYCLIYTLFLYILLFGITIILNIILNLWSSVLTFTIDKIILTMFIVIIPSLFYSLYYLIFNCQLKERKIK